MTRYTVSRDIGHTRTDGSHAEGSGLWYVHMEGYPHILVFGEFHETKGAAMASARRLNLWSR